MNKITTNWRRMRTFANPGILFQTETSYSSPVVILPDSRGVQADPQVDLERVSHMGNLCPAKEMIRY
ncbi:hypothetical protein E6H35_00780 [Candidatus Bathyarchaeota archaeon]|nr:MAG: hypothetical protein E6H35_00780 [Candidatus Bathyarchaeota archaeon]